MDFAELCAKVGVETNRPDLTEQIKNAVLSATLQMHGMDFFFRDMSTAQVVFDEPAYIQTLDTSTFPRFRTTAYIRRWDPTALASQLDPNAGLLPRMAPTMPDTRLPFFDILSPDDILGMYGQEKVNVAYQVGTSLMLKSAERFQFALMGWYTFPYLGSSEDNYAGYKSWIAELYPWTIIYAATSNIFQKTGMQEASRKYDHPEQGLIAQHLKALLISNVTAKGY